jgi:hypothetical protein
LERLMANRYRLRVQIDEERPPAGAAGLLLPLPPTTPYQEMTHVTLDPTWSAVECAAHEHGLLALFATFPGATIGSPIEFEMTDIGHANNAHFSLAAEGREPGEDVKQAFAELHVGAEQQQTLRQIVDCIGRKFTYHSGLRNDAPLTCNVLTGNCLSINTALIALAELAGIKTAYYIGYFFENGWPTLTTDDWHCWVSTLTSCGYESWDIAHHLKRGLRPIGPALNPIPGVRFAMSIGRNMVFRLPFRHLKVAHLCEPRWVFDGNRSESCRVRVTADPLSVQEMSLKALEV